MFNKLIKLVVSTAIAIKDAAIKAYKAMAVFVAKATAETATAESTKKEVEVVEVLDVDVAPKTKTTEENDAAILKVVGFVATAGLTYLAVVNFPITILYAIMFHMTYRFFQWMGNRVTA